MPIWTGTPNFQSKLVIFLVYARDEQKLHELDSLTGEQHTKYSTEWDSEFQFQESLFQCRWSVPFHIGRACTFLKYAGGRGNAMRNERQHCIFFSQDLHWEQHLKKYVVATCYLTLHLQISHWEAVLEQNQICNLIQKLGSILHITWLALFICVEV